MNWRIGQASRMENNHNEENQDPQVSFLRDRVNRDDDDDDDDDQDEDKREGEGDDDDDADDDADTDRDYRRFLKATY